VELGAAGLVFVGETRRLFRADLQRKNKVSSLTKSLNCILYYLTVVAEATASEIKKVAIVFIVSIIRL
jgi:hypothetical protein